MCSHDKWTIWLSHGGLVKIRICQGCHEPELLNTMRRGDPEWETMLDQTIASEGSALMAPPQSDEIPF